MKKTIHTKSVLVMTLLGLAMAACNGKSGSSSEPTPAVTTGATSFYNPATLSCAASGGQGSQILAAPSEATYTNLGGIGGTFNMKFCLQLIGDANQITQWQNSGRSAAYYYSGTMSVSGNLNLSNVGTMGNCILPAGAYTIASATQGGYDPISFNVPQFEAVNGANRIVFQIRNGYTRDPNMDYLVDRLSLDVVALSVSVNGTTQVCNDIQGLFLN